MNNEEVSKEVYEFLEKELCFFISKRGLLLKTYCFVEGNIFIVCLKFEDVKKNKDKKLLISCLSKKGRIFDEISIKEENFKKEELKIIRLAVNACAKKIFFGKE